VAIAGTAHLVCQRGEETSKTSLWSYRHAQAHIQLTEDSPLFCYKLAEDAAGSLTASSLQDLVIARLDQKKDQRQLETPSGIGAFAFGAGLSKERTHEIIVTEVSSGVFLISAKAPLSPGEYVLGGSSLAITGYDFGVRSK
jgi:hypothetical protein